MGDPICTHFILIIHYGFAKFHLISEIFFTICQKGFFFLTLWNCKNYILRFSFIYEPKSICILSEIKFLKSMGTWCPFSREWGVQVSLLVHFKYLDTLWFRKEVRCPLRISLFSQYDFWNTWCCIIGYQLLCIRVFTIMTVRGQLCLFTVSVHLSIKYCKCPDFLTSLINNILYEIQLSLLLYSCPTIVFFLYHPPRSVLPPLSMLLSHVPGSQTDNFCNINEFCMCFFSFVTYASARANFMS